MSKSENLCLVDTNTPEYVRETDLLWFLENHGVKERIRAPFPCEEYHAGGVCSSVQVIEVEPGVRARFLLVLDQP